LQIQNENETNIIPCREDYGGINFYPQNSLFLLAIMTFMLTTVVVTTTVDNTLKSQTFHYGEIFPSPGAKMWNLYLLVIFLYIYLSYYYDLQAEDGIAIFFDEMTTTTQFILESDAA
jgi:hypothetical protein